MEVYIVYSDPKQISNITAEENFIFLDEGSIKTRKKAFQIKNAIGAKLTPLVVLKDKDKYLKAFYREEFDNPIQIFKEWTKINNVNEYKN